MLKSSGKAEPVGNAPVKCIDYSLEGEVRVWIDQQPKCRKHSPAARLFYISLVFSNDHRVLSQCNTRLRLLYLLTKEKIMMIHISGKLFEYEMIKTCIKL